MSEELIRLREIESAARDVLAYPAGSPRDVWNRLAVALGETALHADCGVCDEQSRLAEIGALVERFVEQQELILEDDSLPAKPRFCATVVGKAGVYERSLLEALRALAAELEVSGE